MLKRRFKIDKKVAWGIFIFVFLFAIFLYRSYNTLASSLSSLQKSLAETQLKLAQTDEILGEIINGNEELEARLSAETKKRLLAEQSEGDARSQFEDKIVELQTSVKEQQDAVNAGDITNIIANWSPRVARLTCEFSDGTDNTVGKGSSVATLIGSIPHFITNKHVVEDDLPLSDCRAELLSGETVTVPSDAVTVSEKVDVGYIRASGAAFSGIDTSVKTCSNKPAIGDAVVILGYPRVGGSGITATEGIISGFDDEYYVTSAKIEQGNSGGAAVHVKNNCLLGMPTLVVAGRIEALARILPI